MQNHRKPPKPPFYHTGGAGSCRQCGEDILKKDGSINKRASWHPACVTEYRLVHFPNDTRRAVWKRDKGVCYLCREVVSKKAWEMEHIKPLFEAEGDLTFWQLPNIAVCCVPCHRKKSAEEAGRRAAIRKAAKAKINIDK
jgi:hypothetical protein